MKQKTTSELSPARNEHHRLWSQFSRDRILIILVSISCIVATASFFRAERAIDAANKASTAAETWQTMYKETERECRLAQNDIAGFYLDLMKAGIESTHGVKQ